MQIKTYIKHDFICRDIRNQKEEVKKNTKVIAFSWYEDKKAATGYRILIILPNKKILSICAGLLEYRLNGLLYLKPYHLIKPVKYLL